jgi:hypothetical protein
VRTNPARPPLRDIAFLGDADLAELEDEKSFGAMLVAERRVHFRPARSRHPDENSASTKLPAQQICGRRVSGWWQAHFDAHRPGIGTLMASARRIEHAHSVRDDARVDRDRARLRAVLASLTPDAAGREHACAPLWKGGTGGQCEQRKISSEMAHVVSRQGPGQAPSGRRRLRG